MKKLVMMACVLLVVSVLAGCGDSSNAGENGEVYVFNWGEYIDPATLEMFEEETGIKVVYDEFETNEIMYPRVAAGASKYDVICPSDYMIHKMIANDMLQEINFDHIPNAKANIGAQYYEQAKEFDPNNSYCVPYCWGTVGILYNKTMVDDPVTSWSILWNEKYKDNILMQDSVRDAFMVALKLNGFSMNSLNEEELQIAKNSLIEQAPLVQAKVVDQVRDKMIGGEAALGVIYSGEAIFTQRENPDLEYVIPEEGTNVWIDGWVIPKNAPNVENAEKFIDFMCRDDIALLNFMYITYASPNTGAKALIDDDELRASKMDYLDEETKEELEEFVDIVRDSEIAFPDLSQYNNLETFIYLGEDGDALYNQLWKEVNSAYGE